MERTVFFLIIIIVCSDAHKRKDTAFIPYGLAQYSFLWEYSSYDNEKNSSLLENSNRIGIYYGFLLKINPKLMFQFQFGNDWSLINKADYPLDTPVTVAEKSYLPFCCPFFHLAYIRWDPGIFYVEAGKIPVENSGPLDLIERSLATDNFQGAAFIGWSTATNNSLLGTKTGLHLFHESFSPEFFATLMKKSRHDSQDNRTIPPVLLFIFNMPFRRGRFSLAPQIVFVSSRSNDHFTGQANNETGLGFRSTYELNNCTRFYTTGAWARLARHNSKVDSSGDYLGFQFAAGTSWERGKVLLGLETRYSRAVERRNSDSKSNFFYCELKSIIKPRSFISIIPKIRFFQVFYSEDAKPGKVLLCPEVIFRGQF
jgi:hypothetical protein